MTDNKAGFNRSGRGAAGYGESMDLLTWIGILLCVSQSAMFSGLNLAFFGMSRLRLEVERTNGNRDAERVLQLREDSNFLLVTILWGNVGVNVLLTLLSNSVLAGVSSFLFSTVVITLIGEIMPQAYFSRHALRMAAMLGPLLRCYQYLLYPVAKPSALLLDWWLGKESILYFREQDITEILRKHVEEEESDITHFEGIGAMNFLAIDDMLAIDQGEVVHPASLIPLETREGQLVFPDFQRTAEDPFIRAVAKSDKKWVILTDANNYPHYALDSDKFLREALLGYPAFSPWQSCHTPIIVEDQNISLGDVILQMKNRSTRADDISIDKDLVLVWGDTKKIVTGADILGRLLEGVLPPTESR
jgi:metal transporter CNNM